LSAPKGGALNVLVTGFGSGSCRRGSFGGVELFAGGDAEELLAVVAFDQLAADVVGDGEELAAAEIGAEELYRHVLTALPWFHIGRAWSCLEESRVFVG